MLSAESVHADFGPSFLCCALVTGTAMLAATALWRSALDAPLSLALTLALVLSAVDACRRTGLRRGADAVSSISGSPEALVVQLGTGERMTASLCDPVFITRFCAVFTLQLADGARRPVPVFRDSMSPDAFRRLRVFLRFANRSVAG